MTDYKRHEHHDFLAAPNSLEVTAQVVAEVPDAYFHDLLSSVATSVVLIVATIDW